jgi:hypothetical protein
MASYLPYKLSYEIMKKKVRVVEFKASFNMGIGAVLFLIYYTLQFFVAKALAPNAWWALLVLIVSVLTSLFCLWISPFRKKTFGILRVLKLKSSRPQVVKDLANQRKEIIRLFKELS